MMKQNRESKKTSNEKTMFMYEKIEVMTPQQVAEHLQVHVKTVYEWINDGKLQAAKLGPRSLRIRKEDVDSFLEERLFIHEDKDVIQNADQVTEKASQNGKEIDTEDVKKKKVKAPIWSSPIEEDR